MEEKDKNGAEIINFSSLKKRPSKISLSQSELLPAFQQLLFPVVRNAKQVMLAAALRKRFGHGVKNKGRATPSLSVTTNVALFDATHAKLPTEPGAKLVHRKRIDF